MRVQTEELVRLGGVRARDVVEGSRGDVVSLALADQAVVLEQILLLRLVQVGSLLLEDALGLASDMGLVWEGVERKISGKLESETYSEMFSNSILVPRAWLAAVASSSPAQSIGPVTTIIWPRWRSSKPCLPLPARTWAATWATSCGIC